MSTGARRSRTAASLAAAVVVVACGGCTLPETRPYSDGSHPGERVVQLWCADLPSPLTAVAVHGWFAGYDPARPREWRFWEVHGGAWVERDARGSCVDSGWRPPSQSITDHRGRLESEWRGADAERLWSALEASLASYPHRHTYVAWPGPNSNTYVAWVLKDAGLPVDLDPKAIGKDFVEPCLVGAGFTTGYGVHVDTPIVGASVGWLEGLEVHVFAATVGLRFWPPALKTPVGRFGPWADEWDDARRGGAPPPTDPVASPRTITVKEVGPATAAGVDATAAITSR